MFKDLDGDGIVSTGDNTIGDSGDRVVIGNSTPRYRIGLNLDVAWKGIDFSVFFQGVLKRDYAFSEGDPYFWELRVTYGKVPVLKNIWITGQKIT